jgi:hypothetical protein
MIQDAKSANCVRAEELVASKRGVLNLLSGVAALSDQRAAVVFWRMSDASTADG